MDNHDPSLSERNTKYYIMLQRRCYHDILEMKNYLILHLYQQKTTVSMIGSIIKWKAQRSRNKKCIGYTISRHIIKHVKKKKATYGKVYTACYHLHEEKGIHLYG